VRDSIGVTYGHQGQLSQDTLNGNDVQDRFLVVKLIYHTRSYRLQPSHKNLISINAIICISHLITIMCIIQIITIIAYNRNNLGTFDSNGSFSDVA
jgi:hypothetical protein